MAFPFQFKLVRDYYLPIAREDRTTGSIVPMNFTGKGTNYRVEVTEYLQLPAAVSKQPHPRIYASGTTMGN